MTLRASQGQRDSSVYASVICSCMSCTKHIVSGALTGSNPLSALRGKGGAKAGSVAGQGRGGAGGGDGSGNKSWHCWAARRSVSVLVAAAGGRSH